MKIVCLQDCNRLIRASLQEKCLADHLQEKCLADQLESSQERFKRLCILRGLVVKEIEERNELDETMLMAAAADGRFVSSPLETLLFSSLRALDCTDPRQTLSYWFVLGLM